jgi:hypothetical protein
VADKTVALSHTRDATTAAVVAVPSDMVVEVETEKGHKLWTTAARLQKLVTPRTTRGVAPESIHIGPDTFARGASRGIVGKVVLKTLRFLHVDIVEGAAELIAHKWEQETLCDVTDHSAVLYRCTKTMEPKALLMPLDTTIPTSQPILIFLHGTASSTRGSFAALWEKPAEPVQTLFTHYKQHVYALEHKTLTASPIQNAINLVEVLPEGARVHLISHSRGGLIGELLCRGGRTDADPFDAAERQEFDNQDSAKVRGELAQLNELLKARRPRVERFVRVACPVRGTTLASQRLDVYLSILFNLLSDVSAHVPGLGTALDIFAELVMAIAKERANPAVLPGLEAMMPESPLVRLLNRPALQISGEMRVIAGDIGGDDLASLFKRLLTDPFYQEDHDLVVNTEAMFGGATRQDGQAYYLERGPSVSHFRYF